MVLNRNGYPRSNVYDGRFLSAPVPLRGSKLARASLIREGLRLRTKVS
ncbi:hypothetical protein [Nostoc sp. DedQUE04]|nr:hypothetical protein [Nostoc sp. DedQUE04]